MLSLHTTHGFALAGLLDQPRQVCLRLAECKNLRRAHRRQGHEVQIAREWDDIVLACCC